MSYIAFQAFPFAPDGGRQSMPVPGSTDAEKYMRSIAGDIWKTVTHLRHARMRDDDLMILVPAAHLNVALAREIDGGDLFGIPIKVTGALTEPRITLGPLKRMAFPDDKANP